MNKLTLLPVMIFIASCGCIEQKSQTQTTDISILPDSLCEKFNEYGVQGSFLAYNLNTDQYYTTDTVDMYVRSTPASTFKVFNSLVCFEEGILNSLEDTLRWNGVKYERENWNKDQNIREAFRNSTVWFYQRLAERAGSERMQYWIDTTHYGNMDISGGLTEFWLSGNLRVSPWDQIMLLSGLMKDSLPFSRNSMDKVRELMLFEETSAYVMGAKTGWGFQDSTDYGWFIGYVKPLDGDIWVFATRIKNKGPLREDFPNARIQISLSLLQSLRILPKS